MVRMAAMMGMAGAVLVVLVGSVSGGVELGTGFSYQGNLMDAGGRGMGFMISGFRFMTGVIRAGRIRLGRMYIRMM